MIRLGPLRSVLPVLLFGASFGTLAFGGSRERGIEPVTQNELPPATLKKAGMDLEARDDEIGGRREER